MSSDTEFADRLNGVSRFPWWSRGPAEADTVVAGRVVSARWHETGRTVMVMLSTRIGHCEHRVVWIADVDPAIEGLVIAHATELAAEFGYEVTRAGCGERS